MQPNRLPLLTPSPTGPGEVLHSLIASRLVPVVDLREIFRQAAQSAIITSALAGGWVWVNGRHGGGSGEGRCSAVEGGREQPNGSGSARKRQPHVEPWPVVSIAQQASPGPAPFQPHTRHPPPAVRRGEVPMLPHVEATPEALEAATSDALLVPAGPPEALAAAVRDTVYAMRQAHGYLSGEEADLQARVWGGGEVAWGEVCWGSAGGNAAVG